MSVIDVKYIRDKTLAELVDRASAYRDKYGCRPFLSIILVGSDSASQSYVRTKRRMCEEVGIETEDYLFPEDVQEDEILNLIKKLNRDDRINGILVQLPLPGHMDSFRIVESISPEKDVDGLTSANMGLLLKDRPAVIACTPKGIMRILDHSGVDVCGKTVVVMNRSLIVGRPLTAYLISTMRSATVISCNSHTEHLKELVAMADIVVAATGMAEMIDRSWHFKKGAVIVDVSISRVPDKTSPKGYRVCGDLKAGDFARRNVSYTPVPGGVGLMTVMMLLENTMELAEKQRGSVGSVL